MNRKRILLIFLIIFLLFLTYIVLKNPSHLQKTAEITHEATFSGQKHELLSETVKVARVIDGDTIELTDKRRVRYIGMDTPEIVDPTKPVECFGQEAREENRRLVDGKTVRFEKDVSETDSYGRLLRYVFVGDIFVNEILVRNGFARLATFPPDVTYRDQLIQAQREARVNNRGLWSQCPVQ